MLAVGLGAFADGVGDAERRDDHLARGEAREHADGDLPVEAQGVEDRLHRLAEAAHVGLFDVSRLDLGLDDLGRLGRVRGADTLGHRGVAREIGKRPHDDRDGEDHRAGLGDELRGVLPHAPDHVARLGHLVARQLEDERLGLHLEHEAGEHEGRRHGEEQADAVHADHDERFPAGAVERADERGAHERVDREAGRAAHERHHERRREAGLGVFNRARREEARDRAGESGEHRHEALAVEAAPAEQAVHDERRSRHVAAVLEDADEEEEDQDLRQEDQERPDAADDAVGQQALQHRVGVERRRDDGLRPIDAGLDPVHREFREPEHRGEEAEHDAEEQHRAEDAMEQEPVDGGGLAGFAEAFGDDAFERDAELRVMDERLGGHRVVPGVADAVTGGAEGLLALGHGPAQSLGGRRIRVEEQTLRVGDRDRLTGVGGSGLSHLGERGGDVGGPLDPLEHGLLIEGARDRATYLQDAFALPGGSQHDRHAAHPT